jgi:hypothetical protein
MTHRWQLATLDDGEPIESDPQPTLDALMAYRDPDHGFDRGSSRIVDPPEAARRRHETS